MIAMTYMSLYEILRLMKLPALRRQLAQQVGEVDQVLGDQVADFARTLCGGKSCQVDAFV